MSIVIFVALTDGQYFRAQLSIASFSKATDTLSMYACVMRLSLAFTECKRKFANSEASGLLSSMVRECQACHFESP